MLKIYNSHPLHSISRRLLLILTASIIAFSSVTALFIYKHPSLFANADDCGAVFDPIPQWVTDQINVNKSVYIQVQNEKGVPWELLAAIHLREYTLVSDQNPGNGQGVYQLYSYTQSHPNAFPPGPITRDQFLQQTRLAADIIQDKARSVPATPTITPRDLRANEDNLNLIKSTLFSYNGRAAAYANQAATYGFDKSTQPYEGSPYVMNKFDCKRKGMGLITSDGGSVPNATDTRLGAFTTYTRLKGDAYWNSLQIGNIPGCKAATGTTVSCVWRLYNPGKGNYIYTTSYDTRNRYIAMGYTYQGVGFYGRNTAASYYLPGQIPVYSLTTGGGGTFLTASYAEYSGLKAGGWTDNGIAFYANPEGSNAGTTVYRLYNGKTGVHVWTADPAEKNQFIKQGYSDDGIAFSQISQLVQESPAPNGQSLVYRFGDMPNNTHFWTTDVYERDSMISAGYRYEGVAWKANKAVTSVPVYRLYAPSLRQHLYTSDAWEKHVLVSGGGWQDEGIGWYANPSTSGKPVYRLYSLYNAEHFYTTDAWEKSTLLERGTFRDEGIGWRQP